MTSYIDQIKVIDTTTGLGKTGLAFGDFTAKYCLQDGTLTSLTTETITTLGTYQAPTSAAHIRIKELSSADPTKGLYEVHFHDTQLATYGKWAKFYFSASGAEIDPISIFVYARQAWANSLEGIVYGTVGSSSTTSVVKYSSITPAAANTALAGRILIFLRGTTTANLRGQGGAISTNNGSDSITLVSALTDAPASGDVFVVL